MLVICFFFSSMFIALNFIAYIFRGVCSLSIVTTFPHLSALWFLQVGNIHGDVLDSLVPGEETEVQVTVKCAFETTAGHWSSWSHPVRAMVPQSAGVLQ